MKNISKAVICLSIISTAHAFESPKIGGALKLDQRFYVGKKGTVTSDGTGIYASGGQIRDLGLSAKGVLDQDLTYTVGINFKAATKSIEVDDAYVTYKGFKNILPNLQMSAGQVNPGFSIESATSSKWTPFMERSMPTNVFGPTPGLGISAMTFANNYSVTIALTQPKAGASVKNSNNQSLNRSDRWQASTRATWSPIAEGNKIFQIGASAHLVNHNDAGISFNPSVEMKSRNTISLLTTKIKNGSTTTLISAQQQNTFALELSGIYGPFTSEIEYQTVHVKRGADIVSNTLQGENLRFDGYHAQLSYMLTGESHAHNKATGSVYGSVTPNNPYGAYEVSLRLSHVDLNDKDIKGGKATNFSIGASCYMNKQIRMILEYVSSKQERTLNGSLDKRTIGSVGARIQAIF